MTDPRHPRRRGTAPPTLAGPLAAVLLALGAPLAAQESGPEEARPARSFAIPLARHARTRAEDAREHLEAHRWNLAISELQELVEEGAGDVLPPAWRARQNENSLYPAYPGAAAWARRALRELPPEARATYRARYDDPALAALADARTRGGRRPLVAVAERWPLARAAELAWWALGDLELERGHPEDATFAWRRARDLRALFGEELPPGAAARLDLARTWQESRLVAGGGGFRTDEPGTEGSSRHRTPRSLPALDADSWSLPLDLTPFDTDRNRRDYHNLEPTLAADRVLVNSSLHLYAVDAFTGRLLWRQGPPAGWDELDDPGKYFEDLALRELTLRPAARSGVVVAAMQIPYTQTPSKDWQQIDILHRIPERRLYAFDLETGEELWNHCPALELVPRRSASQPPHFVISPAEKRYARLMMVAASPVIAGARVLVPCYRLQGRIDYHLACYELDTGELLWSTALISGQRERNMFGRPDTEFVGSPVTVAGDVVVAQTELGAVAALDLLTGDILWEAEYDQIALQRNVRSRAQRRDMVWQVTAPQVVDGMVIATPSDSRDIIAFELEDGRVRWDRRGARLAEADGPSRGYTLNRLVGVDSDTIFLSGRRFVAVQKPGGFRTHADFRPRWTQRLLERSNRRRPAPLVIGDRILVPLQDERLVLDRWTGNRDQILSGPWTREEYGNAVVGDGVLFTLGPRQLNGYFDWKVLLDRQRALLAARPGDPRTVLDTTNLLVRRARSLRAEGDTLRARNVLAEARALLEPLLPDGGGPEAAGVRGEREVIEAMHGLLRLEARLRADLADTAGALRALAAALPLATGPSALRDTLLQKESLLRSGSPRERLDVLAELEERCGSLPLPDDVRARGPAWLIGEAILGEEDLRGWEDAGIDVGLWVLLTRAEARARQRDGAGALEDLHAALARYGGVALNDSFSVATLVSARIGRRLELDGRGAYAPFERDAANLLERARAEGDRKLLDEVVRLYPHSRAARDANRALLERAYREGETNEVARMVFGASSGPHLEDTDRALGILELGLMLGRAGNLEFLAGVAEALDSELGALRRGLDEESRRELTALLAHARAPAPDPRPVPLFTHEVVFSGDGHHPDQHEYLGALVREGDEPSPTVTHVYLRRKKTLTAFASTDPVRRAWEFSSPYGTDRVRCAVGRRRVFVGSKNRLLALDGDGTPLWRETLDSETVLSVGAHRGVVVAETGRSNRPARIIAFDAATGVRLWEMPTRSTSPIAWRHPVLGEGFAVFLVVPTVADPRAIVVNLFTGDRVSEFGLDRINTSFVEESVWIEGGHLVIPSFRGYAGREPYLALHDLATGRREWREDFERGEEFQAIVAWKDRNYLVTQSSSSGRGSPSAGIFEIDLELHTRRRIATLDVGEEVIGLKGERRTRLVAPWLFVYPTSHAGNSTPIRAVHLPYGRRWVYQLPVGEDELYDSLMPLPAVSGTCVAIAYVLKNPSTRLPQRAMLEFVDLTGGFRLDSRTLIPRLHGTAELELRGLGESLFVLRKQGRSLARGLDVMVREER